MLLLAEQGEAKHTDDAACWRVRNPHLALAAAKGAQP